MSMSYAQLVTAIQQYTENTEASFIANIPNFVKNTETFVNNNVQLPAFRTNVTGQTTANFQYVDLPSDFLSVFSVAIADYDIDGVSIKGPYQYLLNKDVNYIREAFPFASTPQSKPTFYALFDAAIILLGPTPDKVYPIELHYYSYPTSITVAGTSWLGINYPMVLLWGSLVEAYVYMKGEQDMIAMYQKKFDDSLAVLKQLGDGKTRQDNYRTTQVRDAVI